MSAMKIEGAVIADTLKRFGVAAGVNPALSYQTPRANVYILSMSPTQRIKDIEKLEDELGQSLTQERGRATDIRFMYSPFAIVVPRRDPQIVSAKALLESVKRAQNGALPMTLGQHYEHRATGAERRTSWLRVDLSQPETPHMIVAGTTGSGKTTVLKNAILSLAVAASPADVAFILIDPKPINGFRALGVLPHVAAPVVTNETDAMRLLSWVSGELKRRIQVATEIDAADSAGFSALSRPALVIFVDEVSLLADFGGDAVTKQLKAIAKAGRGLGIHLVAGTQRPTADYMHGELLANIPVRAVGAVARREDGRIATGMAGSELMAHRLTGRGDFLLTLNGSKIFPFQAAYLSEGEDARVAQALRDEWWHGVECPLRVELPAALLPDGLYTKSGTNSGTTDDGESGGLSIGEISPAQVEVALGHVPPKSGAGGREEVAQRRALLVEAAIADYDRTGTWVTANALCVMYESMYGVQLKWARAAEVLKRAQDSVAGREVTT